MIFEIHNNEKNNKVIIYTSSLCGFCYRAKSLLKQKNINFQEIDVDNEYEKRVEMIQKSGGRTSVPQIFLEISILGDVMTYLSLIEIMN